MAKKNKDLRAVLQRLTTDELNALLDGVGYISTNERAGLHALHRVATAKNDEEDAACEAANRLEKLEFDIEDVENAIFESDGSIKESTAQIRCAKRSILDEEKIIQRESDKLAKYRVKLTTLKNKLQGLRAQYKKQGVDLKLAMGGKKTKGRGKKGKGWALGR